MVELDVARARDSSFHTGRVRYRTGEGSDYEALKQAHCVLPVDYPDRFFRNVLNESDTFFTVCAVDDGSSGELVGFATARIVYFRDTCYNDQQGLSKLLGSRAQNETRMIYILTIGVKPSHRRQGIAATLVNQVIKVLASILVPAKLQQLITTTQTLKMRLCTRSRACGCAADSSSVRNP
jgi:ribosomal protein S18 acetylase RimI-like enzyme